MEGEARQAARRLSLFRLPKDAQPSPVRVLIAFDKFKNSLTAVRACEVGVRALRRCQPDWRLDSCPLTDGGDGFAEILTTAAHGQRMTFPVTGPRGGMIAAGIGLVLPSQIPAPARLWLRQPESGGTTARPLAIIEMAAASGLSLLPAEQHDPWQATSYGTGQLIRTASELGCAGILLGVGGSATIDLGLGALSALGFEFRGPDGAKIRPPTPMHYDRITQIEGEVFSSIPPICVACDVINPLLGFDGATAVFGAQKGLRQDDQPRMEAAVARLAHMLGDHCGRPSSLAEMPGMGAAGGLPFGLMAGANARLVPGFELVSAWLGLESRIAAADIVITGEGSFDATSLAGKGPGAVAARAHSLGKVVHVFAGRIEERPPHDSWQLHAITPSGHPDDDARREASEFLFRSIQATF
jgi:glycerate kinase